ncbi:nucleotidyltransferase family protein [Neolewinella lacunae]|uniref:Nucleotidyltransferase family protein n=1 Tax=Neolewinella lacunae TaxID=1517758 RepID=A0A923PR74_9BACT|nr:nucleotidyltransferase family protein [Neolewinella lacunae]MBC6996286.1 nucleotidyltransferase family protein [Neolewinella lacunae]MDN3636909.1 nucleotidyltransferase family protein [Neolewinella lacunae]
MVREAIILAGGFGTRLRAVVEDRPKALAPINGRPFLEYLLDYLIRSGLERFVFSVGYRARQIEEHFGASYRGYPIRYALETEPLGTGGGILNALPLTSEETVLVTNGDSLFLADLAAQWKVHTESAAVATLALRPMRDFSRYGRVELAADGRVLAFREKEAVAEGLINGGVYLLRRDAFALAELNGAFSLEKDFFGALVATLPFYARPDAAYFLDIGIPEDFARAQADFKAFDPG